MIVMPRSHSRRFHYHNFYTRMFIVRRDPTNPIITPSVERSFDLRAAFNGCPVKQGKSTRVLYRAVSAPDSAAAPGGLSTIAIASSKDGIVYTGHRVLIGPQEQWDRCGCEDPRVTPFEGTNVIFYTALGGMPFNAETIKVGVALSKDLETIDERHLVTPFNAKAMALFPSRVGGKVTAVLTAHTDQPPAQIAIAQADKLSDFWDENFWKEWHAHLPDHCIRAVRFDNEQVEVGAQPIETKDGWLLIYSHIQRYFGGGAPIFGIEALLLDKQDPRKIVGRTKGPILTPGDSYERFGAVPNIVFPSGALVEGDRLDIYYGAADTVCAKASLSLSDLLNAMVPERRAAFAARNAKNPILAPDSSHAWERRAVFNAAAIDLAGSVHILYRAMGDDNTSVFGYARSKNGLTVDERSVEPAYVPRAAFEMKTGSSTGNSGCEDPRAIVIGERVYVTYTAFNGAGPWVGALTSISCDDFLAKRWDRWSDPRIITPEGVADKDVCLLPEKIGGTYLLFHRLETNLSIEADRISDLKTARAKRSIGIMGPRPGLWDSEKVGVAGPPIKTAAGWLMIYHGVSRNATYRLGAALLDSKDPTTVIARTVDTIFQPEMPYEQSGQINHVVFSCGMVARKDTLFVYYGGADSVIGVATFSIKKLLAILQPKALA